MAYDSEYDGRMIAATRNIESLFEAINHFEQKRAADAARVEALMAAVAQLTQDVARQQQQIVMLQASYYEAGVR